MGGDGECQGRKPSSVSATPTGVGLCELSLSWWSLQVSGEEFIQLFLVRACVLAHSGINPNCLYYLFLSLVLTSWWEALLVSKAHSSSQLFRIQNTLCWGYRSAEPAQRKYEKRGKPLFLAALSDSEGSIASKQKAVFFLKEKSSIALAVLEKADRLPLGPLSISVLFIWGTMNTFWSLFASGSQRNLWNAVVFKQSKTK